MYNIKYHIFKMTDTNRRTLHYLMNEKFISAVAMGGYMIVARYGVNKRTLKSILTETYFGQTE